jgi:hypothetical protein
MRSTHQRKANQTNSNKKNYFLFLLVFIFIQTTRAQIHEVGVFLGGSNFIGDVGKTYYINPTRLAFGVLYKHNSSPYHAWRAGYTQSKIIANDKLSDDPGRKNRKFPVDNTIQELSLGLEFNFMNFNLHNFEKKVTPYFFTGISVFKYDSKYFNGGARTIKSNTTFAIPITLGVKAKITQDLILAGEVGPRYTLVDDIDGSNPEGDNYNSFKFGNINNNDWYVFSGLTLTYTFGEKPCYCAYGK